MNAGSPRPSSAIDRVFRSHLENFRKPPFHKLQSRDLANLSGNTFYHFIRSQTQLLPSLTSFLLLALHTGRLDSSVEQNNGKNVEETKK